MNIIACVNNSWGIGYKGELLFKIPQDMRFFKDKTYGKTVIYGRKTMEGFPGGKPLVGRNNIVITSKLAHLDEKVEHSAHIFGSITKFMTPKDTVPSDGKLIDIGNRALIAIRDQSGEDPEKYPKLSARTNLFAAKSIKDAITMSNIMEMDTRNVFICGGASIYEQFLPFCEYAYITKVDSDREADAFMPNLDKMDNWEYMSEGFANHDDGEDVNFKTMCIYRNKDNSYFYKKGV